MTVKVRRVSSRGTSSRDAEVEPQNWAGDAYRKVEQERLAKVPKGKIVHLGRGVRTARAGDLPPPKARPSTEGMTRVTSRGTATRRSRNKGSQ